MALENLKENIEREKELILEILIFKSQLSNLEKFYPYRIDESDRKMLVKAINSCMERLRIINNSLPEILDAITPYRSLGEKKKEVPELVKISYPKTGEKIREAIKTDKVSVTINKKDKDRFLRELSLSKETLKRLKKEVAVKKKLEFVEFKKPNFYAKLANKIFLNISTKYSNQGKLKKLNSYLRKANMPYLVTTYFSIVLLSSLIAFILAIFVFIFLLFLKPGFLEILRNFLIIIFLPIVTFLALYFYPYAEEKSIEKRINQELPFVTIHMSAIAGSGIEPSQIFKIIALGDEYPGAREEFKKIVNQVNVYGYDVVTALKNTAMETSSRKFAELLNGIATTIVSGGTLTDFFDKRAETLLFEYKLEKERKTKSAETFMDIYISIVIAAPMIMTLLLVLIAMSGIGSLSLSQLTLIILSVVSLINIVFMVFLHLSQTGY